MIGDKLTVTEADRNAAAEMWRAINGGKESTDWQAEWMTDGTADYGPVVQAFARHRTNTTTELAEALREIVALDQPIDIVDVMNPLAREAVEIARKALTLHDRALGK